MAAGLLGFFKASSYVHFQKGRGGGARALCRAPPLNLGQLAHSHARGGTKYVRFCLCCLLARRLSGQPVVVYGYAPPHPRGSSLLPSLLPAPGTASPLSKALMLAFTLPGRLPDSGERERRETRSPLVGTDRYGACWYGCLVVCLRTFRPSGYVVARCGSQFERWPRVLGLSGLNNRAGRPDSNECRAAG